jgi:arsenate reductase
MLVIFALARSGRPQATPAAVGAYIGAAYFFTSSTSFANPAIAVGRMFSDTFAGIAPSSVPSFVAAEIVGGALAVVVIRALYPGITPAQAADIVVPHQQDQAGPAAARSAHDGAATAPGPPGPAGPPPSQP